MALSRKFMMDGEQVVTTTRTHVKVLFVPLVILLAVAFAGSFLAARAGGSGDGYVRWAVVAIAVVVVLWGSVLPFLRWLSWTYSLTTQRLVEQKGILTREGRVIPLSRINDVSYGPVADTRHRRARPQRGGRPRAARHPARRVLPPPGQRPRVRRAPGER